MSSTPVIKFSTNWNRKLENNLFSSFRVYNPAIHFIKNTFDIIPPPSCKHIQPFQAYLEYIKPVFLNEVDPLFAWIDTGYSLPEFTRIVLTMYSKQNTPVSSIQFAQLIFHRTDPRALNLPFHLTPYKVIDSNSQFVIFNDSKLNN